jgi:hypothetical protein
MDFKKEIRDLKPTLKPNWLKCFKRCAKIYNMSINDYLFIEFYDMELKGINYIKVALFQGV